MKITSYSHNPLLSISENSLKSDYVQKDFPTPPYIIEVAKRCFQFFPHVLHGVLGAIDLFYTAIKKRMHATAAGKKNDIVARIWNGIFRFKNGIKHPQMLHGAFLLQSAAFGTVAAMHNVGWIYVGKIAVVLGSISGISFVLANFISLVREIIKLRSHRSTSHGQSSAVRSLENKLNAIHRHSAKIGIAAAIGHIIATAMTLLGGPAVAILFLTALTATFGSAKIIYDFINRHQLKTRVSKILP